MRLSRITCYLKSLRGFDLLFGSLPADDVLTLKKRTRRFISYLTTPVRTIICAECTIFVAPIPEVARIRNTCIAGCSVKDAESPHPLSVPRDKHAKRSIRPNARLRLTPPPKRSERPNRQPIRGAMMIFPRCPKPPTTNAEF